jgi:hypothetical protein
MKITSAMPVRVGKPGSLADHSSNDQLAVDEDAADEG